MGISVIMLLTLARGGLARKVGQPRLVGEVVAGILLGPSVFERSAPNLCNSYF
jgi:Kef-type K+ transport system membrane component KefB